MMSEIIDKNLLANLESLGLSEKEARVYIDLLAKGRAVGASKIVFSTGLHGQFVYNALATLEAKGLVKHSIVNGRKKFQANAPERLIQLVDEKKIIADRTRDMLAGFGKKELEQGFEVYEGEGAYMQRQFDALSEMSEGDSILIISTVWGDMFKGARPEFFEDYEREREKRKVSIRFLVNESLRGIAEKAKKTRYEIDYRVLPEHQSHSGICMYKTNTDFLLFGNPIVSFSFCNETVTQGYRNFFNILWEMGRA